MTIPAVQLPGVNQPTVSTDTGRLATRDNLDKAGQQFESLFVGMMLKSMRSANLGESLFESNALDQFRDMQDQQTAKAMAAHAPLGIGKAMTDFLAKSVPAEAGASPTPPSAASGGPST
ncbi:rod-binding protein [Sphingomonas qomolangmaensis]|uniref:Rod-binding protein n=1 Tax=Sphingomonas qomolangmaensis TaxID=2918765 RepID=A0ABY5L757_9SPHN|nr:rod-binding protein [Sphingomonas qomolangmaensis]UUL82282.1 rod-binding protein [Sphingomonas qomolangmaensis]